MVFRTLRDQLRSLLQLRKERSLPRRGNKPAIGAYVVRDDLRLTIQAGMSDDLWHWLLEQGWREPAYQPDRRRYRDIPSTWVTRLIDAPPELYESVLHAAVEKAIFRPNLRSAASSRPPAWKK